MRIGWFDTDNLDNNYCGKDGGSNIRIPFLRELNRVGHSIDYQTYDAGNYRYQGRRKLKELGILRQASRYRDSLDCVRQVSRLAIKIDEYDAVVVEARSPEFDEIRSQLDIMRAAMAEDVPIFLLDRNNWAKDLDKRYRKHATLLRPYPAINPAFKKQEYFPYWFDPSIPVNDIEPQFDFVYVGNRWGRTAEMRAFLEELSDYELMIIGNWPDREPELCDEFDQVEWLGSMPHFATVPLLSLGRATFHVGKPDYNELGFVTMRAAEAIMARRPCYFSHDVKNSELSVDYIFNSPSDIGPLDEPSIKKATASSMPPMRPVQHAVEQFVELL